MHPHISRHAARCATVALAVALTVPAASLAAGPATAPSAAAAVPGAAAGPAAASGGAASVFAAAGRSGIVLLHWADGAGRAAQLSMHVTGLTPGGRVRLVVSSAACGQPADTASRLLAVRMTAGIAGGATGGIWRNEAAVTLARGSLDEVRSVRLMEDEGILYFCRAASVWDDTDIVHVVSGAYAILDGAGYRGIVLLGPADATGSSLSYSITFGPDIRGVRLAGTSTDCATPVAAADVLFSLPLQVVRPGVAFFRGRTETVDKDETITIGSFRLRTAAGPPQTCAPAVLIALLIP